MPDMIGHMPKANFVDKRKKHGWTQEQLSDISGVAVRTIQRLENGKPAALSSLQALAAAFKCDIQDIIDEDTSSLRSDESSDKKQDQNQKAEPQVYLLPRLKSGKAITDIVSSTHMYHTDYDEPQTREEAEAVSIFMQSIRDWGDIWNDIEPGEQITASFDCNDLLKEIESFGYLVFGIRRKIIWIHSEKLRTPMDVATIILRRSSDPRIVKAAEGIEILPCIFPDDHELR